MSKQLVENINDKNIEQIAGYNYFKLSCSKGIKDKDGNDTGAQHNIVGIFTEMPTFGLTGKWENTPMGDLGSKIEEFFMGDLMKATSFAFGASNFKNQILIDKWTKRMFVGTENQDFNLKWRVYSQNTLGQTDAKQVIRILRDKATIDSGNTLSMKSLVENIKTTISGITDSPQTQLAAELLNGLFGATSEMDDDAKKEWLKKANSCFNNNWKKVWEETKLKYTPQDGTPPTPDEMRIHAIRGGQDDSEALKAARKKLADEIKKLDIEIIDFPTSGDDIINGKNYKIDYVKFSGNDEASSKQVFSTDTLKMDPSGIKGAFGEDDDWNGYVYKSYMEKIIDDFCTTMDALMANALMANQEKGGAGDRDPMVEMFKTESNLTKLKDLINKTGANVRSIDLGSGLWTIDFFSFIFKKPLNVVITNWNVTPSKEMFGSTHVYYDFEVTCKLDQVQSMGDWKNIFGF